MASTKTTTSGGEELVAVTTMPEKAKANNSSDAAGVDSLSWFASLYDALLISAASLRFAVRKAQGLQDHENAGDWRAVALL